MAAGKSKKGKRNAAAKKPALDDHYSDQGQIVVDQVATDPKGGSEIAADATAAPPADAPADEKATPVDPLVAMEEKYLRLRAEYDNYIKRSTREKIMLAAAGGKSMARAVLPVLDDLKRTVDHARSLESTDVALLKGAEMVLEKFEKALDSEGVKKVESVGKKFDPELHDAMMRKASDEFEEGTVMEEFEPGYLLNSEVIRHAKVVVSS